MKLLEGFAVGGALPTQPPVGAPPQTPLWIRLHENFPCLIMHLILTLNNTFSHDNGAYSMQFFLFGKDLNINDDGVLGTDAGNYESNNNENVVTNNENAVSNNENVVSGAFQNNGSGVSSDPSNSLQNNGAGVTSDPSNSLLNSSVGVSNYYPRNSLLNSGVGVSNYPPNSLLNSGVGVYNCYYPSTSFINSSLPPAASGGGVKSVVFSTSTNISSPSCERSEAKRSELARELPVAVRGALY